jgi:putative endonuclease
MPKPDWLANLPSWSKPAALSERRGRGQAAERLAAAFLRSRGYAIEAANVRYRFAELDLVAVEGETLCFVEVRSVSSGRFGSALDSVTWRKQAHIVRAARRYLQQRRPGWSGPVRFDIVAIDLDGQGRPSPNLVRGAFDASGAAGAAGAGGSLPW